MCNRNRIGISVILVLLLFDAVIIKYQKNSDAGEATRCVPSGKINPQKDVDRIRQDTILKF